MLSVRVELPELAQDEAVINLDFNDDSRSYSVSDDSDSEWNVFDVVFFPVIMTIKVD